MDLSNLSVEVRTSSLDRVGLILAEDLELEAEVRLNGVGSWTCVLARTHPLADVLNSPGAGLLVTDVNTGDVVFSGPAVPPEEVETVDALGKTITVSGITDEHVLADMLAWPDPSVGDLSAQLASADTRTGPAETVMHEFVNANIGPDAPDERRNLRVVMDEDLARGTEVTKAARFDNILTMLQDLAVADGITFRVVQVDGKLEFQTSLNPDQGRQVRLGAGGELVSSRFAQAAPKVTRALVGGKGGKAARLLSEAVSDDSLDAEDEWGRRIERFYDRQDADTIESVDRIGSDALSEGLTTLAARIEPNEALCAGFGSEWSLGDTVVIEKGEREHVVPVTSAVIKVSRGKLRVGISLGDPDHFSPHTTERTQAPANDWASEQRVWEDKDPHILTSGEVAAGSFDHTLKWTHIVPRSMQVTYVSPLPRDNFDVDRDNGVLTVDLFGTELAGDRFSLQYQYVPRAPARVPPVRISETQISAGTPELVGGPSFGIVPDGQTSGLEDDSDSTRLDLVWDHGLPDIADLLYETPASIAPTTMTLKVRARFDSASSTLAAGDYPTFSLDLWTPDWGILLSTRVGTPTVIAIDPSLEVTGAMQDWTFTIDEALFTEIAADTTSWNCSATWEEYMSAFWTPVPGSDMPGPHLSITPLSFNGTSGVVKIEVYEASLTAVGS